MLNYPFSSNDSNFFKIFLLLSVIGYVNNLSDRFSAILKISFKKLEIYFFNITNIKKKITSFFYNLSPVMIVGSDIPSPINTTSLFFYFF